MIDFYTQDPIEEINITDIIRIIVFNVSGEKKIKVRNFQLELPATPYNLKNLDLTEVGPSFDLVPRR